ncbi:RNA polymerase sigma factor [candidate division KSB1 bacterium]|nr:RNA polymerase sigma factor [candidate division KSB1 bacterium]
MPQNTDTQLMREVQSGETEKLGVLFEKHNKALYNYFLKQTGSQPVSQDLVQDVFYRILKYRHTYRGKGEFRTWMFSIAHHVRIDHYRKHKHKSDTLDIETDVVDSSPDPEETANQQDSIALLHKALLKLSVEKREILLLKNFHHFKYKQIAQITKSSLPAVKTKACRALKELTDEFNKLAEVS